MVDKVVPGEEVAGDHEDSGTQTPAYEKTRIIDSTFKLFLDEIDFFGEASYVSSQSMKNQDDCGELVELAIRKLLREVIGERFKITHGYIYSSEKKSLSPQIDIIITDRLVTHTLKRFEHLDNLEVVPAEAVVAIFEVKRTLRSRTLKAAGKHLEKIFGHVPLSKDRPNRYLSIGREVNQSLFAGIFSNPLIGIIGLLHEDSCNFERVPWFMDTIYSFKGLLKAPFEKEKQTFKIYSKRLVTDQVEYILMKDPSEQGRILILKEFVAYLLAYLNETSGRQFDINKYFF